MHTERIMKKFRKPVGANQADSRKKTAAEWRNEATAESLSER